MSKINRRVRRNLTVEHLDPRLLLDAAGLTEPLFFGPAAYRAPKDTPPELIPPFVCEDAITGLEDFEDGTLDFGLAISAGAVSTPDSGLTDSVDLDDGVLDGTGQTGVGGHSWATTGNTVVITLPGLMQTAGLVWTDGGLELTGVTFEAFDQDGNSLGTYEAGDIADDSNAGTTPEDRFFGVEFGDGVTTGVTSIAITNIGGEGLEIDHIQFTNSAPCRPLELSGHAYVDTNNDGVKQSYELSLLGVEIRLVGTDITGTAVDRTTLTNGDGLYRFTDLVAGDYTITEMQPIQFVDGKDTLGNLGGDDSVNDAFTLQLTTEDGVDYDFGELGLLPPYVNKRFYLTSTDITRWENIDVTQFSTWYSFDAQQRALLNLVTDLEQGGVQFTLYDDNMEIVDQTAMNAAATARQTAIMLIHGAGRYHLRISGQTIISSLELLMETPRVEVDGIVASVFATDADDDIELTLGLETHVLDISGSEYVFDAHSVRQIDVFGGGGVNTILIHGADLDDVASLSATTGRVESSQYTVNTSGFVATSLTGGGGLDQATLHDTAGDDLVSVNADAATLTSSDGTQLRAEDFASVLVSATQGGEDYAQVYGSNDDDTLNAVPGDTTLAADGFTARVTGFGRVDVYGRGGQDNAVLNGSPDDDLFFARDDYALLEGGGFLNYVKDFERVDAFGGGGEDLAELHDSDGNDTFDAWSTHAYLSNNSRVLYAEGFARVNAYASVGEDLATLMDGAGNDQFVGRPEYSYFTGGGFLNYAKGFDRVEGRSSAGADTAKLYDSAGNDRFAGRPEAANLRGNGFLNYVVNFARVEAFASTGADRAALYDSDGNDVFIGTPEVSKLQGVGFENVAAGFDTVRAFANAGGDDLAELYDSAGNDRFIAGDGFSTLSGDGFLNNARGFERTVAQASLGFDIARFVGAETLDHLYGRGSLAQLQGPGRDQSGEGFDEVVAIALGLATPSKDVENVDYLLTTVGDWL